ncbi:MAG: TolC family protein [Magnetococcales bacterium]|nr:TolC family protein [Magnetococcales bacterium]
MAKRRYRSSLASFIVIGTFVALPSMGFSETLEEAWQVALKVDHNVRAGQLRASGSEEKLDAAKGARLPRFAVGSSYKVLDSAPASISSGTEIETGEAGSLSYNGTVTVPLYSFGRVAENINAAQATLEARHLETKKSEQDLKLAVAEAYVAILRAERVLAVAKSHVESLAAHAQDVKNRQAQGMAARNDLLSAQVSLADAQQQLLQDNNRLDMAHTAYNRLLGRPLTQSVSVEALQVEPTDEDVDALTKLAIKQRPEMLLPSQYIASLRHQAESEKAKYGPQVGLVGGYDYTENRYQANEGAWSAKLSATWSLFDGGIANHRSKALRHEAEALIEDHAELESQIRLQVRQIWLEVQESQKRVDVTRKAQGQAEENLSVTRNRFNAGLANNTEVLDAETLRTKTHGNYDNAVFDAALSALRLQHAIGNL